MNEKSRQKYFGEKKTFSSDDLRRWAIQIYKAVTWT